MKKNVTVHVVCITTPSIPLRKRGQGGCILRPFRIQAELSQKNVLLLIDDKAGRNAVSRLNIPVTGTIGILLMAKEKGWLTDVTF